MSNYNILLFDADNTLFDFPKGEQVAFNKTCTSYGIKATEELIATYQKINKPLWQELEKGTITKEDLVVRRFKLLFDHCNISCSPEDFNRDYLYNLGEASQLLPYAHDLLQELSRDHRIIIITNGVADTQRRRIASSTIAPFIGDIIVSEDTGYQKPNSEFFDYTFKKCNIPSKESCLVIGDSLGADILGAMNYGIASCWFNPMGLDCPDQYKPTYIASNLMEIISIVED